VPLYVLSFVIFKVRLTTFIKANDDDDDPAYSAKTQAPGDETSWGETSRGEMTKGREGETSINQ